MLTIHHLGLSQSERIVWLCEELGIPYELVRYEREPSMAAPAAYKALHPAGTAPIITDGKTTLAESNAVAEYIAHKYGNGRLTLPPSHPDYAEFLFWNHYANGTFIAAFMMDMAAKRAGGTPMTGRTDLAFKLVEDRLATATWFAGDEFTTADILMVFPLTRARLVSARDLSNSPNTRAYLQRIGARPAYQRAMSIAEPNSPPVLT